MEVALFDDVINRGTDNIFANTTTQSDQNINNIERVDYIATNGLTTSNTASDLDSVGFLILERGGNDKFKIAPILALDANGVPSEYGELVPIIEDEWGRDISFTLETSVLRSDNSDGLLQRSADVTPQFVGGVYVSYTDLRVVAGETFFGYSLFANDVNGTREQLVDFTNAAVFPTNTGEADGGLDLIAGGVVYSSKVLVSISDATAVNEGEDATFTVSLQRETTTDVTVNFTTRDGTATADEDYTPITTGTITIRAGETSATIPVDTLTDQIEEPEPETFSVILTNTSQGFIGDTEGIGTIIDVPPTTANQPPVANNPTATTRFGVPTDPIPLQITDLNENEDLTTIDLNPGQDGIQPTRQVEEQGQIQGTFELQPLVENQPPTVIFTPAPGFPGQADPITITYTVADVLGAISDPGTIAVTVTPNQPPTVFDVEPDDRIPNNSNPIPLPLTEGTDFRDDDGDIVSISFTLPDPEQGVLLLNGEEVTDPAQLENLPIDQLGSVTFQPDPAFTGENVLFTYTVTDNDGASSTANITIPINPAPIAEDAEARTRIGIEVVVALDVSDDPPGEVDLNTIDLNPGQDGIQPTFTVRGQGTFTVVENQPSVLFTPVPEFTDEFTGGIVTIPYTIQDDLGAISNPANISVRVNQPPVADNVTTDSTLNVSPVAIPLSTANFRDPDPDGTVETISFTLPTPAQGLLLLDGVAVTDATQVQDLTLDQLDNLTFQPNLAFAGNASFSYTVTDNDGDISNVANITIPIVPLSVPSFPDPVNLPPQAQDKTETITNDGSTSNLPQLIATDPDGTVEFLTIVELPPNGILFLNGEEITSLDQVSRLTAEQAGQLSFQPDPNFIGEASFTFSATDNDGAVSNIATVRLNVEEDAVFPPNQPVDDGGCDCPPLPEFAGIDLPNRPSVIPNPSNVEQPIIGSATEDTLRGTLTDDEILASVETAVIIGFEGNDTVFGTTGDLLIFGDEGSDSLFGDFGNDTIIGTNGAGSGISVGDVLEQDIIYGNEGNDILQGGPGNDTIFSGEQDDFTFGGQDNDIILGDLGNDTLYGDQGDDSMLGDTVDEEEIEPERGLNGVLDLMWGGAGDDSMNGGRGNDTLSGGDGNDDVRGGKEDDLVYGEAGDDLLYGDLGNDHLCGDEGNDTIYGDINDNVNFADTPGQDTLCGGIGNDLMFGNQDNDRLCGGEDSDTLYGGLGEDTLYGELGDDWLFGDEGNDLLFGGSGSDRFLIFSNEGIDTFGDFQLGTDLIALGGGLTFDQLTFTQEGTSTILSLDGQQLAILNNIQVSALTESSFTALVN
jgi:Ca2+-binding RTX toxin-like protein